MAEARPDAQVHDRRDRARPLRRPGCGDDEAADDDLGTDDATAIESYSQVSALVGVDVDLLILAGDRAYYLTGETEAGDEVELALLEAVGAALVAD